MSRFTYIEKEFIDSGISAEFSEDAGILSIKFKYGDKINGFTYSRDLCFSDCLNFNKKVIEIIKTDILRIKQELRDKKINKILEK